MLLIVGTLKKEFLEMRSLQTIPRGFISYVWDVIIKSNINN